MKNTNKKRINALLTLESKFKIACTEKDTQGMINCIVKMRVLQAKMTGDLHLSIHKINSYIEECTIHKLKIVDLNATYYDQSMCENYIDIAKKMIVECENTMEEMIRKESPSGSHNASIMDDEVFEGKLPMTSEAFEGKPPSTSEAFEGKPPSTSEAFEGKPPSTSEAFEGKPPSTSENIVLPEKEEKLIKLPKPKHDPIPIPVPDAIPGNDQLDSVSKPIDANFKPTVILFYASWCGPSQRFLPTWEQMYNYNYNNNVKFITLDCGGKTLEDKKIVRKFGIQHFPTIKMFSVINGQKKVHNYAIRGNSSCQDIMEWIKREINIQPMLTEF
jgi:thiol-disulfide isomerase/thioredoxin